MACWEVGAIRLVGTLSEKRKVFFYYHLFFERWFLITTLMFNLAISTLFTKTCLRDISTIGDKIQSYDLVFPFHGLLCCCQIQRKGDREGIASSRSIKKRPTFKGPNHLLLLQL